MWKIDKVDCFFLKAIVTDVTINKDKKIFPSCGRVRTIVWFYQSDFNGTFE